MDNWKKVLAVVGAAGAAAGVLYFLLQEESAPAGEASKTITRQASLEDVRTILKEIAQSQQKMKDHLKKITSELKATKPSFDAVYQKIHDSQPADPLERHGLSMEDFDHLLDKFQTDPEVRLGIQRIMGMPESSEAPKGPPADAKKITSVHQFMLEELKRLSIMFSGLENKASYDMKTVSITLQAMMGAEVEKKFGMTSEDIERSVVANQHSLQTNQEFAKINMEMQQVLQMMMMGGAGM